MKTFKPILFYSIIMITFVACSDKAETDYYRFPLKLGNSWTYLHSFNALSFTEDPPTVTIIDTMYVTVDSLIQSPTDESCFRVKTYYTSSKDSTNHGYEFVVNRSDGLYLLGWQNPGVPGPFKQAGSGFFTGLAGVKLHDHITREAVWLSTPLLMMPYECVEGKTWAYAENDYHRGCEFQLLAKQNVSFPNGTYDCYTRKCTFISNDEPVFPSYSYFAPVGLVKYSSEWTETPLDSQGNPLMTYDAFEYMELMSHHNE